MKIGVPAGSIGCNRLIKVGPSRCVASDYSLCLVVHAEMYAASAIIQKQVPNHLVQL